MFCPGSFKLTNPGQPALMYRLLGSFAGGFGRCWFQIPCVYFSFAWENVPSDMCAQRRLKSACASAQSDQSLRWPLEETLYPSLSKTRPAKILIRVRECAVWSESSLGAHVRRYVFWRCESYYFSAMMASYFLKEKLNLLGKIGCLLCVLGSTLMVLHSPKEAEIQTMEELLDRILEPGMSVADYVIVKLFLDIFTIFHVSCRGLV